MDRRDIMEPLQRRFLIFDGDTFWLLGYPLALSPTESKILYELLQEAPHQEDPATNSSRTKQNLAVHVNAINRKASAISGRKLSIFEGTQYRLVTAM